MSSGLARDNSTVTPDETKYPIMTPSSSRIVEEWMSRPASMTMSRTTAAPSAAATMTNRSGPIPSPELIAQYTRWQFGSYHGVTWQNLRAMVPIMIVMILASLLLAKPLNALLLGERYAQTMGMNLKVVRTLLVASTAILAGAATAFCGPISFLGIAIPHLTRGVLGTADHRHLLPGCILTGGSLALMADILAQLPGDDVLPVNAVNAVFGAPVVMVILVRWYREAEAT